MGKIKEDIEILKMLCDLSPDEVYYKVAEKALSCGYKAEQIHLNENGMYMYIEGDLTYPALVAHVDTVNDYSSNGKEQCKIPSEHCGPFLGRLWRRHAACRQHLLECVGRDG